MYVYLSIMHGYAHICIDRYTGTKLSTSRERLYLYMQFRVTAQTGVLAASAVTKRD